MHCTKCNCELKNDETICPECGCFITIATQTSSITYGTQALSIPPEIKKWNWGAFIYNIFWGFGSYSYLPLLCLIPIFNLVWIFVCGAKGNEWAWKSGKFNNVEEFLAIQETWNRAGLVSFIISAVILGLYMLILILSMAILINS